MISLGQLLMHKPSGLILSVLMTNDDTGKYGLGNPKDPDLIIPVTFEEIARDWEKVE